MSEILTTVVNPIQTQDITDICDFHLVGDDAIVDGSNILTSWQERVSTNNVNIQGSSLVTTPNHIDGHRSVSLNGSNQGFYFPQVLLKSLFVVSNFYRHATDGGWRTWHTALSNTDFTDTAGIRQNFTNNDHQVYRSGESGGRSFAFTSDELKATATEGVFTVLAYRTITDFNVNNVTGSDGGFSHNLTATGTYSTIGYKSNAANNDRFAFMKSDLVEVIAFSTTEATLEQEKLIYRYFSQKYPSIRTRI